MRKKWIALILCAAVLIGAAVFWMSFSYFNHRLYYRGLETLDLSGQPIDHIQGITRMTYLRQIDLRGTGLTPEQYDYLCGALPNCEITWELPFQGGCLSPDTQSLTLTSLSPEDAALLDYLPKLKIVDGTNCPDFVQLQELQLHRPECNVMYRVPAGDRDWSSRSVTMDIKNADPDQLLQNLPSLPLVERVHLTGKLPEAQQLLHLQQEFPNITFSYDMAGKRIELAPDTTRLDLSGAELKLKQAQYLLNCFPKLEEADMVDCGLSDEEMFTLAEEHPNCFLIWEITVAEELLRTDAEEIDLSGHKMESVDVVESVLPYFRDLKKVVMCDCGIDSIEMDFLNHRHENIRFDWMVRVGNVKVRTDAEYFAPVVTGDFVYTAQLGELRYCHDIVAVDLGHMGITDVEFVRYMPKLKYLIIADAPVGNIEPLADLKELVFLEMFLTPVQDYSPLLGCTALEDLNMCYTYGDPEPIKEMTWLKRLWWSGNWTARQMLDGCLPDTEVNMDTGSSTGGTWRAGQHYKEQRDILGMPYFFG